MKKLLFFVFGFLFLVSANAADYRAALVADMDSGRVLFSENANDALYPASLTKIMTLYLTFDALEHGRLHLTDQLIVSASAANASPVKLGLGAGAKITVEDAIKALTVHSANDVARVLAENLKGGREGNFASLMTDVAKQIGLSQTNFENASGLPDEEHLSSARDIALLSIAVYQHFPQYWKYFAIKSWTYNGKVYNNGNRLLGTYPGADGMKTGFTNSAKYCLVATAKRDGKHVMAVVLGAPDKDTRAAAATRLLDKGFGNKSAPQKAESTYIAKPISQEDSTLLSGESGVQFGAFSSRNAAQNHQVKIKDIFGVATVLQQAPNGMWRVRANGMTRAVAEQLKSKSIASGIPSFVF